MYMIGTTQRLCLCYEYLATSKESLDRWCALVGRLEESYDTAFVKLVIIIDLEVCKQQHKGQCTGGPLEGINVVVVMENGFTAGGLLLIAWFTTAPLLHLTTL